MALKILHLNFSCENIFGTPSLIGSINDKMFLLTNQQVVLMGLIETKDFQEVIQTWNMLLKNFLF